MKRESKQGSKHGSDAPGSPAQQQPLHQEDTVVTGAEDGEGEQAEGATLEVGDLNGAPPERPWEGIHPGAMRTVLAPGIVGVFVLTVGAGIWGGANHNQLLVGLVENALDAEWKLAGLVLLFYFGGVPVSGAIERLLRRWIK
jgi:hypothetical protein